MMTSRSNVLTMSLNQLLAGLIDTAVLSGITIERLVMDSRLVQPGDLFVALPGLTVDGRKFIRQAIDAGASAVIWEPEQGTVPIPISWQVSASGGRVPVIAIDKLSNKVGGIADRFNHEPSKQLFVVGITGTNGKTSCSHFVAQALAEDMHCGVIGTMGWGSIDELNTTTHTTPDVITCHSWLASMLQQGSRAVAMEVSSHALDQGRVNNIHFDCAVFTNLSHEHLDYHGTLESYAAAKAKLFEVESVKSAVINCDDEVGRKLIASLAGKLKIISYGIDFEYNKLDIFADQIEQTETGLSFFLHTPLGKVKIKNSIYGRFNVYNILATTGVLLSRDYSLAEITKRLSQLQPVDGRLSIVRVSGQPTAVIDYAHTPDALEHALKSVKQHFAGETWCVFGCGGDRDKEKRPLMGEVAERLSDHVIVTSDNPRNESPTEIIQQIVDGMKSEKQIIKEDRREAIAYALKHAESHDIVLIAGKGHETYQQVGEMQIEFNDASVAREILEASR
jgi:UDP-N-acetylmuramoyl-L-alanyl-D-glutamate--2,6-diaminopimelate ligase